MSALVFLDTGGSGVVSPDGEDFVHICQLWHQGRLAAMGLADRLKVRTPERRGNATPLPVFLVSVASKGLRVAVNHLESTLTRRLIGVASKGLECWRLRLKTGKTRCLSATAYSKGLRSERREISLAWAAKELGNLVPLPPIFL